MITRRSFTLEEANAMLPLVRRIVNDLLEKGRTLRLIESEGPKPHSTLHDRQLELTHEVKELTDELAALGCEYQDWTFRTGIVDFPSRIGDEEVMLCWRADEPRVEHFHRVDAGYDGRQPLPPSPAPSRRA